MMSNVLALITMSVGGYITGPNDGRDAASESVASACTNWVFGGPWHYGSPAATD
jgi:hypothetical protein